MSITRGMTKALLASLLGLGAVGGAMSCGGSSSNNDQGASFLAYGYFTDSTGETGLTGVNMLLGTDSATVVASPGAGFQADGNQFIAFMGFQNRLASQFIRLERIECNFDVPGASPLLNIPGDSFNSAVIIGPSPAADDRDPDTGESIPLPLDGGSTVIQGFLMLSTDIISYLNVNRNLLPELPFRMTSSCHGVGVTQSGDVLISNELQFQIVFLDQAECCTGASGEVVGDDGGFQGGTGNGGGITFEDGGTSNGGAAATTPTEGQTVETTTP